MPTVPLAENRVGIADVTGAKLQAADYSGTGLQAVGRGLQQVAGAGGEYAQVREEIEHQGRVVHANAAANDARNQVLSHYADRGHTSDDAFYNLGGQDALHKRKDFEGDLDATIKNVRSQLKDPLSQRLFDDSIVPQRIAWGVDIAQHVEKTTSEYNVQQTTNGAVLSFQAAGRAAITNPAESEKQIATGASLIEQQGAFLHQPPELVAANKLKAVSATRHDAATSFINADPVDGAKAALAYVERHRSEMTADDAAGVETHARTAQAQAAAEQRRVANEAKTALREEQRAAGQRAEDTSRLIAEGVPIPAKTLADAEADAKASGRPALVASIRTGAYRNNLTVEYRDSTPAQLQDEISKRSARVAKAGDHPDANDVIAVDHLNTILSKSKSQLQSDPISWGAEHMGLNVPKLDLNDQGSIAGRMRVAQTVSARTGAPLRVLTDEEAQGMAPTIASGTVDARRNLVTQLSRFGHLGPAAAAQVAPGNDQFISLIGLANGASKSASRAHVELVLHGQEALKTNPKLIKADEADAAFGSHIGGALELLPSVASGVKANSRAIFAADADSKGAPDWQHHRDEYPTTVDVALGAYRHDGVVYGGIGEWRGRKTLLPDGWSQPQFDSALSRSTLPQLQRAWNGPPTDQRGGILTRGQLFSNQLVAVADGRYRLTDGQGHYVGRKGGGYFEIDVKKLHR